MISGLILMGVSDWMRGYDMVVNPKMPKGFFGEWLGKCLMNQVGLV